MARKMCVVAGCDKMPSHSSLLYCESHLRALSKPMNDRDHRSDVVDAMVGALEVLVTAQNAVTELLELVSRLDGVAEAPYLTRRAKSMDVRLDLMSAIIERMLGRVECAAGRG